MESGESQGILQSFQNPHEHVYIIQDEPVEPTFDSTLTAYETEAQGDDHSTLHCNISIVKEEPEWGEPVMLIKSEPGCDIRTEPSDDVPHEVANPVEEHCCYPEFVNVDDLLDLENPIFIVDPFKEPKRYYNKKKGQNITRNGANVRADVVKVDRKKLTTLLNETLDFQQTFAAGGDLNIDLGGSTTDLCDKQIVVPNLGSWTCEECNQTFKTIHRKLKHVCKNQLPYKCPKCSKRFGHQLNLIAHIKHNHSRRKSYKCPNCDKIYVSTWALINHVRYDCGRQEPCVCPQCNKVCTNRNYLIYHMSYCGREEPNKCSTCSQTFNEERQLLSHVRKGCNQQQVHRGPKHKCHTYCRTFSKCKRLQKDCGRPHKCPKCDKKFSKKCTLTLHLKHNCRFEEAFKCSSCVKTFRSKKVFDEHIKQHCNIQTFNQCPQCHKSLTKSYLKTHVEQFCKRRQLNELQT